MKTIVLRRPRMTKKTIKPGETRLERPKKATRGTWGVLVDGHEIYKSPSTLSKFARDERISIDTETTGLSPWRNETAIVQLHGHETGTVAIIQTPDGVYPDELKRLLEDKKKEFVVHNGVGFDIMFLHQAGIKWQNPKWYDTLVAETLLASTGRRDVRKSLQESIRRRLGITVDKDIEHGHWNNAELSDRQIEYASQDVIYMPGLYNEQVEKAKSTDQYGALMMEQELVPYVAQMTINGLPCRADKVREYVKKQKAGIEESRQYLLDKFGPDTNLRSPKQIVEGLQANGIDVDSSAKEAIIPIAQFGGKAGELAEHLLNFRGGDQRVKMYSEAWIAENIVNDLIHPHFWQCSADTTRFTCSNPNLQQIPKDSRADLIGNVPGTFVVNVDYSQIEVRIAGYIANDAMLIDLLERGDVHRAVASAVFGKPEDQISARERKLAKAMVFLLLFGGGVTGFYNYVKMSGGELEYGEAQSYVRRFFSTFQGINRLKEKAEYLAQKPGPVFIRLPNGSRRILVGYNKKSTTILNTMVQGSASVGIKHGILEAGKAGLMDHIGGQVHDELVGYIKGTEKQARDFGEELSKAMVKGMSKVLETKILTSVSVGRGWQP